jgi:TonB family protein
MAAPERMVLAAFLATSCAQRSAVLVPTVTLVDDDHGYSTRLPIASSIASYWDRVRQQVRIRWHPGETWQRLDPDGTRFGPNERFTLLLVELAGDGSIANVSIENGSGVDELDRAAEAALRAAAPFRDPPIQLVRNGRIRFRMAFELEAASRGGDVMVGAAPATGASRSGEPDDQALVLQKSKFASFLNRVAQQVKAKGSPAGEWRRLDPTGAIYGPKDRYTRLAVELSPDGALTNVSIENPSGIEFLDDACVAAVRSAAPFAAPPRDLVKDGRIRFRFGFLFQLSTRTGNVDGARP